MTARHIIAHAGGMIENVKYTNSLDAIRLSSAHVDLIEVDVVPARDGPIVAHGNFEGKYGLKNKFHNTSIEEFKDCRFANKFRSLSFEQLAVLSPEFQCKFILDVKPKGGDYEACLDEISNLCRKYGVFENFIIQVYCTEDYEVVRRFPFHGVMIAFWKNFSNIFSGPAVTFFRHCSERGNFDFVGASVDFRRINKDDSVLDVRNKRHFGMSDVQIYIHAQPDEKESELLTMGYGIFSHHVEGRSPGRQS
jgi:hypothetical protein